MSIQNIMNVCFAICITLLIYQNTQLKDDIRYLKINSLNDYEVMAIAEDEAERVIENCEVLGSIRALHNESSSWIEGRLQNGEIDC